MIRIFPPVFRSSIRKARCWELIVVASLRSQFSTTFAMNLQEDKEIFGLIEKERIRQVNGIELIASENYTSTNVLRCLGSILTNKYSEGYPAQRYYGGNEFIDQIEVLCQKRALEAFELKESEWGINVQPYSGSPANFAVYTGILKPHDRIMGMHLPDGGHLTHGFMTAKKRVSATSIFWESIPYRLNPETETIDYDMLERDAMLIKPRLIIAGFSCYTRYIDFERFRKIADKVGAYFMADIAHVSGLVLTGDYPSPFPYAHVVTTTTHKTLRGPRAGMIFYSLKPGPNNEDIGALINGAVFPGLQGGPHNNVIAGIATCLKEAMTVEFKDYSKQVVANSRIIANYFVKRGYKIATNGTDNHIVLLNVKESFDLNGEQAQTILEKISVTVNKNACATDTSVLRPSGIRIGTPAMTTRGFKEDEFTKVCQFMEAGLKFGQNIVQKHKSDKPMSISAFKDYLSDEIVRKKLEELQQEVELFCSNYPHPSL